MLKQQTREEANRLAEEQERAAKRDERRIHYYKEGERAKRYKRRPNIYIFSPEDLDNDDVISAVESTPTYKRTRDILDSINSQASGDLLSTAADTAPTDTAETIQGMIRF